MKVDGRGLYDDSGTSNYSPPELMILFCWPSATEGMMQEMQHVSARAALQRPVLHNGHVGRRWVGEFSCKRKSVNKLLE